MNTTQKSIMWLEAIAILWILGSTSLGIGIFTAITKNSLSIQSVIARFYGNIYKSIIKCNSDSLWAYCYCMEYFAYEKESLGG